MHSARTFGVAALIALLVAPVAVLPAGDAAAQNRQWNTYNEPGLPPEYRGRVQQDRLITPEEQERENRRQQWRKAGELSNGLDPAISALRSCDHSVRNATGVPRLAARAKEDCQRERQRGKSGGHKKLSGSASACWGHYDEAIELLQAASDLYNETRRSYNDRQKQVARQARAKHQQGNEAVNKGARCLDKVVKLSVSLGRALLGQLHREQMERERRQMQGGAQTARRDDWRNKPVHQSPNIMNRRNPLQGWVEAQKETIDQDIGAIEGMLHCPAQIFGNLWASGVGLYTELQTIGSYLQKQDYWGLTSHMYGGSVELYKRIETEMEEMIPRFERMNPHDRGYWMARVLCDLIVADGALRATKFAVASKVKLGTKLKTKIDAKIANTVLAGDVLIENVRDLAGRIVKLSTAKLPIKLGKRYGIGAYGVVYEMTGTKKVIKLIPTKRGWGQVSIITQVNGYDLVRTRLPGRTPKILARADVLGDHPGHLVLQDVTKTRWGSDGNFGYLAKEGQALTRAEKLAMKELHHELGDRGLVWTDGHRGNVYFYRQKGRVIAGVLDTDRIFDIEDWFGGTSFMGKYGVNAADDLKKGMGHFGIRVPVEANELAGTSPSILTNGKLDSFKIMQKMATVKVPE